MLFDFSIPKQYAAADLFFQSAQHFLNNIRAVWTVYCVAAVSVLAGLSLHIKLTFQLPEILLFT